MINSTKYKAAAALIAVLSLAACGNPEKAAQSGIQKVLFQKTGTRRQAELVARLIGDLATVPFAAPCSDPVIEAADGS